MKNSKPTERATAGLAIRLNIRQRRGKEIDVSEAKTSLARPPRTPSKGGPSGNSLRRAGEVIPAEGSPRHNGVVEFDETIDSDISQRVRAR